jgi:hypothetical protein
VERIAEAADLPILETFNVEGPAPENGSLFICANAFGLEIPQTARTAVILGDVDRAPPLLRANLGIGDADALRLTSSCYACATTLADTGAGRVVREADFRDSPGGALAAVIAALDLAPVAKELDAEIGRLEQALADRVDPDAMEGALMERVLATYRAGEPTQAWWPRELFTWPDAPETALPETLDITGVARNVVVGPFISLPAGHWRATATFDLDEEAARRIFLFSFGTGQVFSRHQTMDLRPGRNEISLAHHFATAGAAEFAIGFPYGAFDGALQFRGLTVERCEAPT